MIKEVEQEIKRIRKQVSRRYSFWFEGEDNGLVYQMDATSKKEVVAKVKEVYGTTKNLVVEKWTH